MTRSTEWEVEQFRSAVEGQFDFGDDKFPVTYDVAAIGGLQECLCLLEQFGGELLAQAHLHGAVLLKNTSAVSAEDFDAIVRSFGLPEFPYEQSLSNAVRKNKTERVFTANEAPSNARIYLHHEMAQTPIYPSKLLFFCEHPARRGGETPICRSDELVKRLIRVEREFVHDCLEHGLQYSHTMPFQNDAQSGMGRSWRSTFRAETVEECKSRMAALEYTGTWHENGSLTVVTPVLPAVKELKDGRHVFFNQLIAAYSGFASRGQSPDAAIRFGNGRPLPESAVRTACEIAEELSFDIPWGQGDVAIVDNLIAMHGRRSFEGPRSILASLIA